MLFLEGEHPSPYGLYWGKHVFLPPFSGLTVGAVGAVYTGRLAELLGFISRLGDGAIEANLEIGVCGTAIPEYPGCSSA